MHRWIAYLLQALVVLATFNRLIYRLHDESGLSNPYIVPDESAMIPLDGPFPRDTLIFRNKSFKSHGWIGKPEKVHSEVLTKLVESAGHGSEIMGMRIIHDSSDEYLIYYIFFKESPGTSLFNIEKKDETKVKYFTNVFGKTFSGTVAFFDDLSLIKNVKALATGISWIFKNKVYKIGERVTLYRFLFKIENDFPDPKLYFEKFFPLLSDPKTIGIGILTMNETDEKVAIYFFAENGPLEQSTLNDIVAIKKLSYASKYSLAMIDAQFLSNKPPILGRACSLNVIIGGLNYEVVVNDAEFVKIFSDIRETISYFTLRSASFPQRDDSYVRTFQYPVSESQIKPALKKLIEISILESFKDFFNAEYKNGQLQLTISKAEKDEQESPKL